MSNYILAIDQGTTGTTLALVDRQGQIIEKVNNEFPQHFPKQAWVEHDLEDIWATVLKGIDSVLKASGVSADKIAAIGITNQRETSCVWDASTGKPLHRAIVWQCRRTTARCQTLAKNKTIKRKIESSTGLVIDPYFSSTKFEWFLKNIPGLKKKAKEGSALFGTIDSYLIYRLTDGESHVTDVSNASRTQLMNLKTLNWDKDLLKIFGVPEKALPDILPSSGEFGFCRGLKSLPDGLPIAGVAGDQQAALFGQYAIHPGDAKCTFGTGSFILMNTGSKLVRSKSKLLTTVAWQLGANKPAVYALEGGAFICGAAVQWLRDGLKFIQKSSEVEDLAKTVSDSQGVEFVPALTGLGAPYWRADARGVICGLTRGTHRGHVARATLEAMALQNADILNAMQKDLGKKLRKLKVDGGAAANNLLMQMQADYLGTQIERPDIIETTVAGAAYLAGLGVGFWPSLKDIEKVWRLNKSFKAQISTAQRSQRLKRWHAAVEKA